MANKTLAEAKESLKTEKIHEVGTSFLVNDFGKYRPNIVFVISKNFERSPIAHRSDEPTKKMLANMNIDFDGETSILFGDYWQSQKGGACFRPKPVAEAKHVLIRCEWGGASSRTRGIGYVRDVPYYRRAASNGGGVGSDYLVVKVGFCRVLHDDEIDVDATTTAPNFAERAKAIREKFTQYDREQDKKASTEARAKAQAEATSKAAKADLLPRLEAVNERLTALGREPVQLGEFLFKWGWQNNQYFSERNVAEVERSVTRYEAECTEKECKRLAREAFRPKFEKFKDRAEVIGLIIEFCENGVRFYGDFYDQQPYSEEGLAKFAVKLHKREVNAKADAEAAEVNEESKIDSECEAASGLASADQLAALSDRFKK